MIEKLAITNFRGIKKGELELFPITILLGPNNSAKSTVLEALFLVPDPCRGVPYLIPVEEGPSFRRATSSRALDVVYYLHQSVDYRGYGFLLHNYTSEKAEIEGTVREIGTEAKSEFTLIMTANHNVLRFVGARSYTHEDKATSRAALTNAYSCSVPLNELGFLGSERSGARLPPFDESLLISPKLLKVGYSYLRTQWSRVVNSGIARKIATDTSKFSKEAYQDFTMEPVMGAHLDINAYLADGRRIRLADLGEGVQSYAMSRILYELANPKILLWDDMESHFNPRILGYLADWFNDLVNDGRQIVLSSHSLEAAQIIAGVNEEKTRIYVTSLSESTLKAKPLTLSKLEEFQGAGIDARIAEDFLL